MRNSIKAVRHAARNCGLHIAYYNPGDNPTYKVLTRDVDYFAASSSETLIRAKSLRTAAKFVERYCTKKSRKKRSR